VLTRLSHYLIYAIYEILIFLIDCGHTHSLTPEVQRRYILFRGSCVYRILEIMVDRSKPEFKPIVTDEKKKDRGYFCIACGSVATQTAFFKIEGATIVERYCDRCAKSIN
jgi:hypothetical protein